MDDRKKITEEKNMVGDSRKDAGEGIHVDALLREGRTVQLGPQGYSMYPLLVPGRDQVVISPAKQPEYRRGDVVLYRRKGSILVLHRVWKRTPEGYYLVGDNQKEIEGPVGREQILGVMTMVLRRGKKIPVENAVYRTLAWLWLMLRPWRPFLSHFVAGIKGFFMKSN